jgi:exopolysaccharide biosynthesis polyprenyl glycosylphosphotransferase
MNSSAKVIGMSSNIKQFGPRPPEPPIGGEGEGRGGAPNEVLSRERFLEQLHLEKRRADRSRAPLSLVVMHFAGDSFDIGDLRDVLTDLRFSTRETDRIGYMASGVVAFLLPYSDAKAAEQFSKLVVDRIDGPPVSVEAATYKDPLFDTLLQRILSHSGSAPTLIHKSARSNRFGFAIKRLLDILGATVLLVLVSPLMIVIAVAVKLSSPGPIIFKQQRVGRGGVPFKFYKFRSMRTDGDDSAHREYVAKLIAGKLNEINQGEADNPVYKMRGDKRITPIGKIIRKTSIDELPQLINVLKGEMSLVGPRPPIPYEAEKYESWHMRRLQEVRPGLTGLWQVEGRSKTSFDDMVRLDLRYIRNWSLWLDFKILFKTVAVVVRCDGAD